MIFSLAVAFIVSPWAASRIFRGTTRRRPRRQAREGWRRASIAAR